MSSEPKCRTPWRSNLLFTLFVSLFSAFAPISVVGHMTSIGTLFAFVLWLVGEVSVMRARSLMRAGNGGRPSR